MSNFSFIPPDKKLPRRNRIVINLNTDLISKFQINYCYFIQFTLFNIINMKKVFYLLILTALISCNGNNEANSVYTNQSSENTSEKKKSFEDGTFCADVIFHNPNTGTTNKYQLNVEVNNRYVEKVLWPNGGWLDDDHYSSERLDDDNECSITTDKGYEYEIKITGEDCAQTILPCMTLDNCIAALNVTEEEKQQLVNDIIKNKIDCLTEGMCEVMVKYVKEMRALKEKHKHQKDSMQRVMGKFNAKVNNGYIQQVFAFSKYDRVTCQLVIVKRKSMFYMLRVYSSEKCKMGLMNFNPNISGLQDITVQEDPSKYELSGYSAEIIDQSSSYSYLKNEVNNYCSF